MQVLRSYRLASSVLTSFRDRVNLGLFLNSWLAILPPCVTLIFSMGQFIQMDFNQRLFVFEEFLSKDSLDYFLIRQIINLIQVIDRAIKALA